MFNPRSSPKAQQVSKYPCIKNRASDFEKAIRLIISRVSVIIAEWYNSLAEMRAMRSFFDNKFWIILLSVLAVGALLGLATGMSSMSFREAQDFGSDQPSSSRASPADLIRTVLAVPVQTQLVFWFLVVGMFALIAVLLSPEARKRLLRSLFRAFFTYWALYLLFTRYPQILTRLSMSFTPSGNSVPAEVSNSVPPPAFTPPPSASWMTYLASLAIMVLAVFFVWKAYGMWKVLQASSSEEPVRKLARIARVSLQDLSSGRDSTDVILNCYFRMSDVVAERRNLNRGASMTPHEFATRLEQAGLPGEAVKQLTRLFETVRYGGGRTSPVMVREAVACLTAILQDCGEPV